MSLIIDSGDRISNKYPPIDSTDMTELNADLVIAILDNLVNGQYRWKAKSYTITTRPASGESGEIIFLSDLKQFNGWNGDEWVTLG